VDAVVPGRPESRSLELPAARVLAVSGSGDLALALETNGDLLDYMRSGTLARTSLAGGAPRELLARVYTADWGPGGNELAVVRDFEGRTRLEFPPGNVLYESTSWISHARVSPAGQIAFIEHPFFGDTRGVVMLASKRDHPRPLTADYGSAMGLAWSPRGDEVWFTAGDTLQSSALRAVSLDGAQRILLRSAGALNPSTKDPSQLIVVPTGPGESRTLQLPIAAIAEARWFPDGKQAVLTARERAGGPLRVFILELATGKLRLLTEADVRGQEAIS